MVDSFRYGAMFGSAAVRAAAEFARWLLAPRPQGQYEVEFRVVDAWPARGPEYTVEIGLGREDAGGPEYLVMWPSGYLPGIGQGADVGPELMWEPVDRAAPH